MSYSLDRARSFLAGHGRLLDRRRFELLTGGDPAAVIAAVDGYRSGDGGYGWGIEPDLRDGSSQPAGALHALEVFAEAPDALTGQAEALFGWLAGTSLPDGGLPFALGVADPTAVAPFWAQPTAESSLHITLAVAAQAHLLADRLPALAGHDWLAAATDYCLHGVEHLTGPVPAHVLSYAVQFLDAASSREPAAPGLLDRLAALLPADGLLRVAGGAEGEALRPLEYAPWPARPARRVLRAGVIEAELARLTAGQQDDGGWLVDFDSYSPAAALEWRGYATVRAVAILLANEIEPVAA